MLAAGVEDGSIGGRLLVIKPSRHRSIALHLGDFVGQGHCVLRQNLSDIVWKQGQLRIAVVELLLLSSQLAYVELMDMQ
ncbi:hypothetical protein [Rhizobium laguerreae]|uniref:hypothetical protein n=1 Tax=Rhizobium laguerreae TaxID=1076926 RepID=UPI001C918DD3|nr:hypothetical protein [Rhizobium laguerreae]MBY3136290.1 hypothetical protein [Rhizobium laguerreae]